MEELDDNELDLPRKRGTNCSSIRLCDYGLHQQEGSVEAYLRCFDRREEQAGWYFQLIWY